MNKMLQYSQRTITSLTTPTSFFRRVFCPLVFLVSVHAQAADTPKQISYPVPIQVEKTPVAPAPVVPAYSAPAPVIRSVEEASSVPPKPARKAAAKAETKKATTAPAKKVTDTAAKTKAAANDKKKNTSAQKTVATKTAAASTAKKVTPVKKPVAQTAKSNPATAANKATAPATKTAVNAAEKKTVEIESYPQTQTAESPKTFVAAAAPVAALIAEASEGDTEDTPDDVPITQILSNDVSGTELQEKIAEPAPPPPTSPSINALPLPMSNQREAFVTEFQNYVETKIVPRVPGVALAIISGGKVKVLQAYGVKRVGGRDGINVDTAFRLASVSKTIAGTAAGVLVGDGLITWDTLVTTVLPDVTFSNPKYGNQLTLQHIMSQSTGLPTHTGDNFIEDGASFAEVVNRFKYVNFVCPPGKCYAYQNVSLSLLSNIVQKKTGKTYEQYVREKLFAPLGMRSASFGMDGLKANNNYALPHVLTARGWYAETITENYYRINPAAGANASISDMSRWVLAQMGHNPDVLPPSTLNSVHNHVTKNTPAQSHYGAADGVTNTYYGMGWRVFDYRGDKNFLHHGGYVLGFRSEMVFNPELQIGMVILSNSNKLAGSVIFQFLDAYEDEKRGPRKIALPTKKKK